MVINIKEVAQRVADDLQISDADIELLKGGEVPYNWTNTVFDILADMYQLEDKIIKELIK